MEKHTTLFVGLDVHKDSIAVGVAPAGRDAPWFIGTVAPQWAVVSKALKKLGKPKDLHVVYEAGPCGYSLARELRDNGYRCDVVAPSKIVRQPADRVKTDRRDALLLARAARAGDLVPILVPDQRDEAIRDLTRAREDAIKARLKARQQLKALLLRNGHTYSGKTSWTAAHERYLAGMRFEQPAQNIAFVEYRDAVRDATERVERISKALVEQLGSWRMQAVVEALMSLRGIDTISAMTLVAEIGDFHRFANPRELMGFLGLVPSERSSGTTRRQGGITKTGNGHARRVLVEAAWSYRFSAKIGRALQIRQEKQSKAVRAIAWKAQLRLTHRFRHLSARKVAINKACIAVARELCGFIWDIARQDKVRA